MWTRLGTHGRLKVALLTIPLLTAVVGCGAKHSEQAKADAPSEGLSPASAPATVVAMAQDAVAQVRGSKPTGPVHRITLTDKRCIRFEPQWTNVRVGQSVTWHSDLKAPVRIYVSPGVFAKASFLVRPGATITTGPAHSVGRFSFWTEPSACRDCPRGVLLAGPGVRVQETFYASTGPR